MAKVTYRNIGGTYVTRDNVVVKRGGTFETGDPDICKKFPLRFERVHRQESVVAPAPAPVTGPIVDKAEPEGSTEASTTDGREEVTADFKTAQENALQVYKDKRGYWVYDQGDTTPIHGDAPLKKRGVNKAIQDYLGGGD